MRRVVIVAGPTCSGKSALAMDLAERLGGIVINADAMQCYRDLRVLTARPSQADEARVPHALYGVRDAAEAVTAAWWRDAALTAIGETDRVPILCGGTGMYLNALFHGLAAIPEPGASAREEARSLLAEIGAAGLHARLAGVDPATAARIRKEDGQRLARAWEVWRGTGRALSAWQQEAVPKAGLEAYPIAIDPDRAILRDSIGVRWGRMLEEGALDEVRALDAQGLDPALPIMRAHGVPELRAVLAGTITLGEAERRAVLAIGQYTKRQATWLRHHSVAPADRSVTIHARYAGMSQFSAENMAELSGFLSHSG